MSFAPYIDFSLFCVHYQNWQLTQPGMYNFNEFRMKTHLRNLQKNIQLPAMLLSVLVLRKIINSSQLTELSLQANQGGLGASGKNRGEGTTGGNSGSNMGGNRGGSGDFDDTDDLTSQFQSEGEQEENEDNDRVTHNDPDAVGKMTGRTVDEPVLDQTDGGTTQNMYSSSDGATTAGQVTAPSEAIESPQENYGAGAAIKSGDIGSSNAGKDPSSPGGTYVEVPRKPTDRLPGTGSGAASNDKGERIEDIDSGTGSAQRGNQAGVNDPDEGTITDL